MRPRSIFSSNSNALKNVIEVDDDPYSTPARRRRIIADFALFLLRQYCVKACKNVFLFRKETNAAIQIQNIYRMHLAITLRSFLKLQRDTRAAVVIQCAVRRMFAVIKSVYIKRRNAHTKLLSAAPVVQLAWRVYKARKMLNELRENRENELKIQLLSAVQTIQRVFRGYICRRSTSTLILAHKMQKMQQYAACVKIQNRVRILASMSLLTRKRKLSKAGKVLSKALWTWRSRSLRKKSLCSAKKLVGWMKRKLQAIRLRDQYSTSMSSGGVGSESISSGPPGQTRKQLAVAVRIPLSAQMLATLMSSVDAYIVNWCLGRNLICGHGHGHGVGYGLGPVIKRTLLAAGLNIPTPSDEKHEIILASLPEGAVNESKSLTADIGNKESNDLMAMTGLPPASSGKEHPPQAEVDTASDHARDRADTSRLASNNYDNRCLVVTKSANDIRIFIDCRLPDDSGSDTLYEVANNRQPPVTSVVIVLYTDKETVRSTPANLVESDETLRKVTVAAESDKNGPGSHPVNQLPKVTKRARAGMEVGSDPSPGNFSKGLSYTSLTAASAPRAIGTIDVHRVHTERQSDIEKQAILDRQHSTERGQRGPVDSQSSSTLRLRDVTITFTVRDETAASADGAAFFSAAMAVVDADDAVKPHWSSLGNVLDSGGDDSVDIGMLPNGLGDTGTGDVQIQYAVVNFTKLNELVESKPAVILIDSDTENGDESVDDSIQSQAGRRLIAAIETAVTRVQAIVRGEAVRKMIILWDRMVGRIQKIWRKTRVITSWKQMSAILLRKGTVLAVLLQKRFRGMTARRRVVTVREARCQELSDLIYAEVTRMISSRRPPRYTGDVSAVRPNTSGHGGSVQQPLGRQQEPFVWTPPTHSNIPSSPSLLWSVDLLRSVGMSYPTSMCSTPSYDSMEGISLAALQPEGRKDCTDASSSAVSTLPVSTFTFGDVKVNLGSYESNNRLFDEHISMENIPPLYRKIALKYPP